METYVNTNDGRSSVSVMRKAVVVVLVVVVTSIRVASQPKTRYLLRPSFILATWRSRRSSNKTRAAKVKLVSLYYRQEQFLRVTGTLGISTRQRR